MPSPVPGFDRRGFRAAARLAAESLGHLPSGYHHDMAAGPVFTSWCKRNCDAFLTIDERTGVTTGSLTTVACPVKRVYP